MKFMRVIEIMGLPDEIIEIPHSDTGNQILAIRVTSPNQEPGQTISIQSSDDYSCFPDDEGFFFKDIGGNSLGELPFGEKIINYQE